MQSETHINSPRSGPKWLLIAAFLGALAVFTVRGIVPSLRYGDDFVLVYGPARVWLNGGNPYRMADVDAAWTEAGLPADLRPPSLEGMELLYPPTTLVMFAPFAALPWTVAHVAWVIANMAFLALTLALTARLAGWRADENRWWALMIAALLFAPVHTAFKTGQTSLYVLAMVALGFGLAAVNRPTDSRLASKGVASGVLLGFASLIKPQIGLPFLAMELLRRRWTAVIAAVAACVVIAIVAIAPMSMRGHPWLEDWKGNLSRFTEGSVGDPTALNPARHQLLNLHYPLHTLIESRTVVNVLVLLIVGALAVLFFRFWILDFGFWITGRRVSARGGSDSIHNPKSKIQNPTLLPLSMVAVLTLMVAYHRYYDAVLLLLPLAWAIGEISRRRNIGLAWGVLLLVVPYFLNAATALKVIEERAAIPSWILDQWWWNAFVMPQQAWVLAGIAVLLILANQRSEVPPRRVNSGQKSKISR